MKIKRVDKGLNRKMKEFMIEHNGRSITLALSLSEGKKTEVQVYSVDYGTGPVRSFSQHGKLKDLLQKFIGTTFTNTRAKFIDELFFNS